MAEIIKTPTVSPVSSGIVDTYVPPASQTVQPSELTSFLKAIAPAMEQHGDETLKAKAKRDRELASGEAEARQHQINLETTRLLNNITTDYKQNSGRYAEEGLEKALTGYREYANNYFNSLEEQGVDKLYTQPFRDLVEVNLLEKVVFPHQTEQRRINKERLDNTFLDTIRTIPVGENSVEEIKGHFENHVKVNGGDYTTYNDMMVNEAVADAKLGNFDSPRIKVLETLGANGTNLLNNPKYQQQRLAIETAKANATTVSATEIKRRAKSNDINQRLQNSGLLETAPYAPVDMSGLTAGKKVVELPDGTVHEYVLTKQELETAFDAAYVEARIAISQDPKYDNMPPLEGEKARADALNVLEQKRFNNFYKSNSIIPPETRLVITEGISYLDMGDIREGSLGHSKLTSLVEGVEKYVAYGGRIDALGLSKEQTIKLRALLTAKEINASPDVVYSQVQSAIDVTDTDDVKIPMEDFASKVDRGILHLTNLDEVMSGTNLMKKDFEERVAYNMRFSNMSREQAEVQAGKDLHKDYQVLKVAGQGSNYSAVKIQNNRLTDSADVNLLEDILFKLNYDAKDFFKLIQEKAFIERGIELIPVTELGGHTYSLFYTNNPNPNVLDIKAFFNDDPTNAIVIDSIDLTRLEQVDAEIFAQEALEKYNIEVDKYLSTDFFNRELVEESQAIMQDILRNVEQVEEKEKAISEELGDVSGLDDLAAQGIGAVVGSKRVLAGDLDTPIPVQEESNSILDSISEAFEAVGDFTDEQVQSIRNTLSSFLEGDDDDDSPVVEEGTTVPPTLGITIPFQRTEKFQGTEENFNRITSEMGQELTTAFSKVPSLVTGIDTEDDATELRTFLLATAYHESDRTFDPAKLQGDDPTGAGRGVLQYEAPSLVTAIKRMRQALGSENMPEWAKEMDAQADAVQARQNELLAKKKLSKAEYNELYLNPLYDASKLTLDQQLAIAVYDITMNPDTNVKELLDNLTIENMVDFWAKYWHKDASAEQKATMLSNTKDLMNKG